MLKQATSKLRLLSRVGTDLMGATPRELKKLKKMGIPEGFDAATVRSLRHRGQLPKIRTMLEGFNKGTMNMINWEPKNRMGLYPVTISHKGRYRYDPLSGEITVPRFTDKKLQTRSHINDMIVARHEARERVRNIANMESPRAYREGAEGAREQIGSSHMPGVISDERIAYNSLNNSLGERYAKWAVHDTGDGIIRGSRDVYIGNRPPKYEFDLQERWRQQALKDSKEARRLLADINRGSDVQDLMRRYRIIKPGVTHETWLKKLQAARAELEKASIIGKSTPDMYRKRRAISKMIDRWQPISPEHALDIAYYGGNIPLGRYNYMPHDAAEKLLTDYRKLTADRMMSRSRKLFPRAKKPDEILDSAFRGRVLRPDEEMEYVMSLSPYAEKGITATERLLRSIFD